MKFNITFLFFLLFCFQIAAQKMPITGHSHNDYEQKLPLKTAFNAGMGSIEADVYLVNNNLFVAHEAKQIDPKKTLDNLYLKPLAKAVRRHKAYPMVLLIDVKTLGDSSLQAIIAQIRHYSVFVKTNCPVKFVISGNRPSPEKWATIPSFIQFDGRPNETYSPEQLQRIGMISESFGKFSTFGQKDIPEATFNKMKTVVDAVHAQGKKMRFWATPDSELVWKRLANMGVDFINTDTPKELGVFLKKLP